MDSKKKSKIFILDTSAILSGKPINLDDAEIFTTPSISNELKPGGRDYQSFNYLTERGLSIHAPSKESIDKVKNVSIETGDSYRLSKADIEIIALALDIKNNENETIILTDDYSIQNVANVLNIKFEAISQSGITKRFKWIGRCWGCGKKFKENIKICPICGAEIKTVISSKEDIE
ncbi:MAG: NOB1 family endonuclease [Thermoplasmatales archaeon]|nr:NOB1 family endonuclease [Thermoplasmatales archaeon]MCK5636415.1 NOB1 family endonuclease [Thermoplasmatales archaeon]